ncbi:MAG: methyltransferase type 11, partial [Anaerolineae bacterium]|nr:methyltransferase type 11 [Anaerolineae bacterium]
MTHDAKSLSQQQFGKHAAGYVTSTAHSTGYSLDQIAALLQPRPGWRVLDVATGGGHTALQLASGGAWTVAGDLTHNMLRAARDHITARATNGPVTFAQH